MARVRNRSHWCAVAVVAVAGLLLAVGSPAEAAPTRHTTATPSTKPAPASAATQLGLDPARDNSQPGETLSTPLTKRWSRTFAGYVSYPLIVGSHVYVLTATAQNRGFGWLTQAWRFNAATGAVEWGPTTLDSGGYGLMSLAYDGNRIFVSSEAGVVRALSAATGARVWARQLPDQPYSDEPLLATGGTVYVEGDGHAGTAHALDETTGKIRWSTDLYFGAGSIPSTSPGSQTVFFSGDCGTYALATGTGAIRWHQEVCSGDGPPGVVGGGRIYVNEPAPASHLLSGGVILNASTGARTGSFGSQTNVSIDRSTAILTNYVNTRDATKVVVTAVNESTKATIWRRTFPGDPHQELSPIIAGGIVYLFNRDGTIRAVTEKTGAVRWTGRVPDYIDEPIALYTAPALAAGFLAVPTDNSLTVFAHSG